MHNAMEPPDEDFGFDERWEPLFELGVHQDAGSGQPGSRIAARAVRLFGELKRKAGGDWPTAIVKLLHLAELCHPYSRQGHYNIGRMCLRLHREGPSPRVLTLLDWQLHGWRDAVARAEESVGLRTQAEQRREVSLRLLRWSAAAAGLSHCWWCLLAAVHADGSAGILQGWYLVHQAPLVCCRRSCCRPWSTWEKGSDDGAWE